MLYYSPHALTGSALNQESNMTTIILTQEQEDLAESQARDWRAFAEYVDPAGAMATSEEEFRSLPYEERLTAARESIYSAAQ